jgi:hypothetical protein
VRKLLLPPQRLPLLQVPENLQDPLFIFLPSFHHLCKQLAQHVLWTYDKETGCS